MASMAPGLLASGGIHLSQSGKRVFAHKVAGCGGAAPLTAGNPRTSQHCILACIAGVH